MNNKPFLLVCFVVCVFVCVGGVCVCVCTLDCTVFLYPVYTNFDDYPGTRPSIILTIGKDKDRETPGGKHCPEVKEIISKW